MKIFRKGAMFLLLFVTLSSISSAFVYADELNSEEENIESKIYG